MFYQKARGEKHRLVQNFPTANSFTPPLQSEKKFSVFTGLISFKNLRNFYSRLFENFLKIEIKIDPFSEQKTFRNFYLQKLVK